MSETCQGNDPNAPKSTRTMVWLYLLFAVAAGAMLPFQFGINAQLSHWLSSPIRAAVVRRPVPSAARLGEIPWWVWIGGLLGAFYVAGSIVTAPKLGAATLT